MNLRFIERIWHIKGSLPLPHGQSADQAFERLDGLFGEIGTSHARAGGSLTFSKKDPPAQDKLAVFESGVLWIEPAGEGEGQEGQGAPVLRYHLISRALLYCFLAPLLFLAFAQFNVLRGKLQAPPTAAEKAEQAKKKAKEDAKPLTPLNPIDKFLGAPAPEKPKKDKKDKKPDPDEGKPSPIAGYAFAGIFFVLYLVGRFLEAWLVKRLFRRKLQGA
ncbi:MAG: hypothetical protein P0Y56_17035 [Candidatus Andeanibacterium colombiense]|uniref:Uncharacterized protein n=1 Tax=Candidatus Andeanibacterium colombiense TaxID=3121345 RepID=A0AAJ6BN34_9SPHN|nr:MAG: hypothetical protein P0Y56_17035 [Sphingomonadaceae bacterium]